MKHQLNQKWLLSALLLAALGSQYYFSVSSNQIQSIEMASHASDDSACGHTAVMVVGPTNRCIPRTALATPAPVEAATPAPVEAVATEGGTPCNSPDCGLTPAEIAQFRQLIPDLQALLARTNPAAPAAPAEPVAPVEETPLEARRRAMREAQEQARDAQEMARLDMIDRRTEFLQRVQDIKNDPFCQESLAICIDDFSYLLEEYTDERNLPVSVVNAAFESVIGGRLDEALSSDPRLAQSALQALMAADIPQAYRRSIRDNGIESVRQSLTDMSNRARTENNPELALSIVPAGQAYSNSILRGLRMSGGDASLERYMRENFSQEVAALFASTSTTSSGTDNGASPSPSVDGRSGIRGAGDQPSNGGTVTIQPLQNAGQATVGQPIQNSRGNTRGSY